MEEEGEMEGGGKERDREREGRGIDTSLSSAAFRLCHLEPDLPESHFVFKRATF